MLLGSFLYSMLPTNRCNAYKISQYLNPTEEKSVDSGSKRMSTRKKEQHVDHPAHRCLAWRNGLALDGLGHLHIDQPRARKPAKKAQQQAPAIIVEEERVTRSESKNKKGEKPLGRQGSRYQF